MQFVDRADGMVGHICTNIETTVCLWMQHTLNKSNIVEFFPICRIHLSTDATCLTVVLEKFRHELNTTANQPVDWNTHGTPLDMVVRTFYKLIILMLSTTTDEISTMLPTSYKRKFNIR